VVRASIVEFLLPCLVDYVVGWGNHLGDLSDDVAVVKQPSKRRDSLTQVAHSSVPLASAAAICRRLTAPSRIMPQFSFPISTTVLGMVAAEVPPSRYTLIFPPNAERASSRVVAGGAPARFALVAVIGRPRFLASATAIGCAETLTPTPPPGPISSRGIDGR